jgi:hypothetical protein
VAARLAPTVLQQYGFSKIKLAEDTWLDGCPRSYFGITGTAEHTGQQYKVAVCWRGSPPHQQVAVITEKLR